GLIGGIAGAAAHRLTRETVPAIRSKRNTPGWPPVCPGTRLVAVLAKTTQRPSALTTGGLSDVVPRLDGKLPVVVGDARARLTSRVDPETRSQRKTSVPEFPSTCPGTTLPALLVNTTWRPSALIASGATPEEATAATDP